MQFKPVLLALLAAMPPAWAQQTLPTITVSGEKEKGTAETLTAETIAKIRKAHDTALQRLTTTPGVSTLAGGPASPLPTIRGLADERLRITIDNTDLTATCPNHMNTPLSYVSAESIAQATIYPSITPVSVGGDAIGGAIVVERKKAPFASQGKESGGELSAFLNNNGNGKESEWAAWYGSERFAAQYRGSFAQHDNYTAGAPFKDYTFSGRPNHSLARDEVGSSAYLLRNHAVDFGWRFGDDELRLALERQKQPYQNFPNQRMDLLDNEARRATLTYSGSFDWGNLESLLYSEHVDHFMDFGRDKRYWYGMQSGGPTSLEGAPCAPLGPTCAAGMPMYASSVTHGVKVKATIPIDTQRLFRFGGEWNRYTLDDWWPPSGGGMWPGTFWNIRNGERTRTAAFLEWEAQLTATWSSRFGVRVEEVRTDADPVQGYAATDGAPGRFNYQLRDSTIFNASKRRRNDTNWNLVLQQVWQPTAHWSFGLDLARQVRSPSLYERYPWSTWQMAALMNNFVGDGNGYVGNLDLKPEKAYTIAARILWRQTDHQGWQIEWRPYYSQIDDFIDAIQWDAASNSPRTVPVTNQFTVLKYVNQNAKLYGYELSASGVLAQNGWGTWRMRATLVFSRGSNRDTGDNLYGLMPRHLILHLDHKKGRWNQGVTLEAVERKTRVNRMRNETPTAGYALLHWSGSWQLTKQAALQFGIDNLFDRYYELPLGGAYVGQGTTMTNPPRPNYPQWGTPVPGPGRTMWAGLRIRF